MKKRDKSLCDFIEPSEILRKQNRIKAHLSVIIYLKPIIQEVFYDTYAKGNHSFIRLKIPGAALHRKVQQVFADGTRPRAEEPLFHAYAE